MLRADDDLVEVTLEQLGDDVSALCAVQIKEFISIMITLALCQVGTIDDRFGE
jgi:hypothetical protein